MADSKAEQIEDEKKREPLVKTLAERFVAGFANFFRRIRDFFKPSKQQYVTFDRGEPVAPAAPAPRQSCQTMAPQPAVQPAAVIQQPAVQQHVSYAAPAFAAPARRAPQPFSPPQAVRPTVAQEEYYPRKPEFELFDGPSSFRAHQRRTEGQPGLFAFLSQVVEKVSDAVDTVTRTVSRSFTAFALAMALPTAAYAAVAQPKNDEDAGPARDTVAMTSERQMVFNYVSSAYQYGRDNTVGDRLNRTARAAAVKSHARGIEKAKRAKVAFKAKRKSRVNTAFFDGARNEATPIAGGFMANMLRVEGRGQNRAAMAAGIPKEKSAYGKGQFIPSTWMKTVKGCAPEVAAAKTDAEIAAMRYVDDAFKDRMIRCAARANAAYMRKELGRDPTDAEQYMGWQQGPAGAVALIKNPYMNAVDALDTIMSRGAAQRNLALNGGKPHFTSLDFMKRWGKHFGGPVTGPVAAAEERGGYIGVTVRTEAPSPF